MGFGQRALRQAVWILAAVAVGAGAAAVIGARLGRFDLAIVRRTTEFGSRPEFAAVRDLGQLETVRLVQRYVFPHDFLLPDVTAPELLRRISRAERPAAEVLSPEEQRHLQATIIAGQVGLTPTREGRTFVVVTAQVTAGYDLSEFLNGEDQRGIRHEYTERSLRLFLPPPTVLDVRIEDLSRANYRYPPVALDARGWQAVSGFVREVAVARAREQDIVGLARTNAQPLFFSFFGAAAAGRTLEIVEMAAEAGK